MIISERLAQEAFPGQDPLGKRILCCEAPVENQIPWRIVVGVAQDVRSAGPAELPGPEFYLPAAQAPPDAWNWIQRSVVRARADARRSASARRADARGHVACHSRRADFDVQSMEQRLAQSIATARLSTLLLILLAATGLLLAAVGIYGVVSYAVSRRTQEIGVRMALGATRGNVMMEILIQQAQPVIVGVGVGLAASWRRPHCCPISLSVSPGRIRQRSPRSWPCWPLSPSPRAGCRYDARPLSIQSWPCVTNKSFR